jgi:hypothetical protein
MKELIEALNLPKQILDKSEKLLTTLFGEGFKEIGGIFGDKMRLVRLKNQISILNQASQIMDKSGLKAHQINLKTLVPLLEKSSLEEDEKLQRKWANLIANISSSLENGIEPRLINTLSNLSAIEALILDYLYEIYLFKREKLFNTSQKSTYNRYKIIEDIKPDNISFEFSKIKSEFRLSGDFTKIYIDNLESLKLIRYEDPSIQIEDDFSEAEIVEDKDKEQSIDLKLDVSANYYGSDDFHLTLYGLYFMSQCKIN